MGVGRWNVVSHSVQEQLIELSSSNTSDASFSARKRNLYNENSDCAAAEIGAAKKLALKTTSQNTVKKNRKHSLQKNASPTKVSQRRSKAENEVKESKPESKQVLALFCFLHRHFFGKLVEVL